MIGSRPKSMSKIYKYFSGNVFDLVFEREGFCGIKCSIPKEYNDPFELFLSVDRSLPTEMLATYNDIVSDIPQLPTTCFSASPVISPMWAHYAQNQSGFVIEFETDDIEQSFESVIIKEVEYRTEPNPALVGYLEKAAYAAKPRHAVWLQQATLSSAYFTKYSEWSYELECRLVCFGKITEKIDGSDILFVPIECISSIIVGNKASTDLAQRVQSKTKEHLIGMYTLEIGSSYPKPFMFDSSNQAHVFDGSGITIAGNACQNCFEPIEGLNEFCAWCGITEEEEFGAANRNPFRFLERAGRLDEYMQGVAEIESRRRER